MPVKFGRIVKLWLGADEGVSIEGLRIVFKIEKSRASFVNNGLITVYNLSHATRQQIEEEFYRVVLEVGHGEVTNRLFIGDIRNVFHRREGADIATDIYVGDGDLDFQTGTTNKVIPEGTSLKDYISGLVGEFKGLGEGLMQDIPDDITEWPTTVIGNIKDELDKVTKANGLVWSIQDNLVEVLPVRGFVDSPVVISQENGMLGSPVVTNEGVNVVVLLDPTLLPNRKVKVLSEYTDNNLTDLNFQKRDTDLGGGEYVINNITFTGDNRGGEFSAALECQRIFDGRVI